MSHIINRKLKCYSVDILVDFDTPIEMPQGSGRPWKAAGYFQYFYCTESSKEKAKQLVLDFVRKKEMTPELRIPLIPATHSAVVPATCSGHPGHFIKHSEAGCFYLTCADRSASI